MLHQPARSVPSSHLHHPPMRSCRLAKTRTGDSVTARTGMATHAVVEAVVDRVLWTLGDAALRLAFETADTAFPAGHVA